jgi:hypothetical protein
VSSSSTVKCSGGSRGIILTPASKHWARHAMQPKHRSSFTATHLPFASVSKTLTMQVATQSRFPSQDSTVTLKAPRGQSVSMEWRLSPFRKLLWLSASLMLAVPLHTSTSTKLCMEFKARIRLPILKTRLAESAAGLSNRGGFLLLVQFTGNFVRVALKDFALSTSEDLAEG